jgi:hypothetical protein
MGAERWRAFDAEERRALAEALRWRASQLRTYLALADAMLGTAEPDADLGGDAPEEAALAQSALAVLERLLVEIDIGAD